MNIVWVLGSGGLLGRAVRRTQVALGSKLFNPEIRFSWHESENLAKQIADALERFAQTVRQHSRWEICWAAGVGSMGSSQTDLNAETQALRQLLTLISRNKLLMSKGGALVFSSSAGALYAGSADFIITENSVDCPINAYGREKLQQEQIVKDFSDQCERVKVLIARISTLYGPGQSLSKPQGLITHIARQLIRNRPIQIYVPYDTIRDYISTDDAAGLIAQTIEEMKPQQNFLLKIIASEKPVTIAEILSIFKRIARRSPLIVKSATKLTATYPRRVQFRSVVSPNLSKNNLRSLPIGIAQLISAERISLMRAAES